MELNDKTACLTCQIKSKAVETLNKKELISLSNNCSEVSIKAGEYIIREGSLSSHIAYIKEGLLKVHMKGPRKRDQIIRIANAGKYVGLQTILSDKTHRYSASALTDAKICYIDILLFKELITKNSDFANELIMYLCKDELSYYERFVNLSQKQLSGRLCDALMEIMELNGGANEFIMPLSRTDLAALVGASRESTSRALKELADSGVVKLNAKKIQILNPGLLKRISLIG